MFTDLNHAFETASAALTLYENFAQLCSAAQSNWGFGVGYYGRMLAKRVEMARGQLPQGSPFTHRREDVFPSDEAWIDITEAAHALQSDVSCGTEHFATTHELAVRLSFHVVASLDVMQPGQSGDPVSESHLVAVAPKLAEWYEFFACDLERLGGIATLRKQLQQEYARAVVLRADRAHVPCPTAATPLRQSRDELWQQWAEQMSGKNVCGRIRDRWNLLAAHERSRYTPSDPIPAARAGWRVVHQAVFGN